MNEILIWEDSSVETRINTFGKLLIHKDRFQLGPTNVCRKTVNIKSLSENYFELERERLEIVPDLIGDMKYNTVVWIPSINTLCGSDVLFNQAHPFTGEVTQKERLQSIRDIERPVKMDAELSIISR